MNIEHRGLGAGIKTMLDQAQFSQVVANVIHNAAQACRGQGSIQISLQPNASGVELTVRDDGPGMTEEVVERALEPFFTTKEVRKGTGQGLAFSHNVVVNKHGGSIRFETEEGEGTTFVILLPVHLPDEDPGIPGNGRGEREKL